MGYFNYFIKSFIRIFTRKFFWVILLFLLIFVGLIFVDKVNAQVNIEFYYNGQWYNVTTPDNNTFYNVIALKDKIYVITSNNNGFYYQASANILYFWNNTSYGNRANCNVYYFASNDNTLNSRSNNVQWYNFGNEFGNGFLSNTTLYNLACNTTCYYLGKTGSAAALLNNTGDIPLNSQPMRFMTSAASMCDLNYTYLEIDGGSYEYIKTLAGVDIHAQLEFIYNYKGIDYILPFDYDWVTYTKSDDSSSFYINIPIDALHSQVVLEPNTYFNYTLNYVFPFPDPLNPIKTSVTTGDLMYVITQDEADKINMDSKKYLETQEAKRQQEQLELQRQQLELQQQQNQSMQNINDSINNPNVDSSVLGDMPQASTVQDNTGISAIFQQMYNAFCTNQVISFTLDVPFVNESITIDSDYSNNYPPQLKTMASVFWWFVIGLFVLKDVRNIINKIAEGNVENVGSDVQKEVL